MTHPSSSRKLKNFRDAWIFCLSISLTGSRISKQQRPRSLSPRLVNDNDLYGSVVEWSKEVVYLGITLGCKLIFRYTDKIYTKCNILRTSLYPFINRKSFPFLKNKLAVCNQIILPVIEYGMPIGKSCSKCC